MAISISGAISTGQVLADNESLDPLIIEANTNLDSYKNGDGVIVYGIIQNYDNRIHKNISLKYEVTAPGGEMISSGKASPTSNGVFGFKLGIDELYEQTGNYKINLVFGEADKKITFLYTGGDSDESSDVTPPIILQPKDIEIYAETPDALTMVNFDVLAIDDIDINTKATCKPQSGFLFGIGETVVKCTARDSTGNYATPVTFSITVKPPVTAIPDWIKNVAGFWCEEKIDDASFVEAIQYLIDNDIIIIPATSENSAGPQSIPQWVKNNACWWSLGSITDDDFATGIQYLIKQGIIVV